MSLKSVFEENSADDYLEIAKATMRFINTRKRTDASKGIYWTLKDAAFGKESYYDEVCFYAGTSGIICYLLQLYSVTNEESYLEEAKQGGEYLAYRWNEKRDLKRNFSPFAFSTGYAGVCHALLCLYEATKNQKYADLVSEIIDEEIKEAKPSEDGIGYYWSSYPGIVGTAGSILFLLNACERLTGSSSAQKIESWKKFAIEAGRIFLNKGKSMGKNADGIEMKVYSGVDPKYFGAGEEYIDPNFPMGTAGIGFTLLKLYKASGDKTFLDAVQGIPEYMESIAVKKNYALLLPHALPIRPNLFYLGYCHGPSGTCRFWYELYKTTNDKKYFDLCLNFAEGITATGAPEIRSAGYWNYNICCGTAGIMNLFVGLVAETNSDSELKEKYLKIAKRCANVLIGSAELSEKISENENGKKELYSCWRMNVDRTNPERQTTPIGLLDGAAGIGSVLLQLYMIEKGTFKITRAIDDPFPSKI